jgi:hypothetical protein
MATLPSTTLATLTVISDLKNTTPSAHERLYHDRHLTSPYLTNDDSERARASANTTTFNSPHKHDSGGIPFKRARKARSTAKFGEQRASEAANT